jgi:hypothetical protein
MHEEHVGVEILRMYVDTARTWMVKNAIYAELQSASGFNRKIDHAHLRARCL